MKQVAVLFDSQPIRAACFSPNNSEYFVLGTNSKSLKFCKISSSILSPFGIASDESQSGDKGIQMIFEEPDHHNGSIYCVDWSKTSRLVATGSNDKMIKIMVTPNFDELDGDVDQKEILQMELKGHKAIVRTVCFNPLDPTVLLSGGLMENDVKVWDTEKGQNVANLQGHQGNIYSIKSSFDGSFAISVGTDKMVKIWDIRSRKYVD
jgi:WD40 repeat protein